LRIVVDCSVTLSWYIPDEVNGRTRAVLEYVADNGAITPFHWRAEMANGLLGAARRNRIERGFISTAFERLHVLPIADDLEGMKQTGSVAFGLAEEHTLTIYDAIYLETAMRRGLPLATMDKALRRAAQTAGVPVFQTAP